ncbi:MAG: cysteine desulfurase [Candidatus Micrarchaeia archaeon]
MDVEKIRADFPILATGITYLDSAATSLTPEPVLAAELAYYRQFKANVHRGLHQLSATASERYDEARARVARFIGAKPEEIIFTKNATEAINIAASAIAWRRGDVVSTTVFEHHSNLLPWLQLKRRGVSVRIEKDYAFAKSRLIAVGHVSNVLGKIAPVERIVKEKGDALLLVDAAQSAPHFRIDVRRLGCDFLAFSGHKMLGPMGIGVLFMRRELAEELRPAFWGGGTIAHVEEATFTPARIPDKWEAGTPNIAGALGLAAACEYLESIGMESVFAHDMEVCRKAFELISANPKIETYASREDVTTILAFNVKGLSPHDVAAALDEAGRICVRSGHHCALPLHRQLGVGGTVRASFYLYNTMAEAEKLAAVLEEISKLANG